MSKRQICAKLQHVTFTFVALHIILLATSRQYFIHALINPGKLTNMFFKHWSCHVLCANSSLVLISLYMSNLVRGPAGLQDTGVASFWG